MTKIAIIGAGWYGCHIGTTLKNMGIDVTVYETESDIFTKASGNNQFRLHLGFHYARNYTTRIQSRDGYQRFIERYPTLSSPTTWGNIYAVPGLDSLVDFKTYKIIMTSSGIDYNEIKPPEWSRGLSGAISCQERVIETKRAREYFKKHLGSSLKVNTPVTSVDDQGHLVFVNDESYDFVIDCTWGHFCKTRTDVFYEPTLLLYYKTDVLFPAFTLVDGQLASIYPTEDPGIYTLSSVIHTPLKEFYTPDKAREWLKNEFTDELLYDKINKMENHISKYVPEFTHMFKYVSPQFGIKTKIIGATDDRSCSVESNGRRINIMSGKIDTIFVAMEQVLNHIQNFE